MKILFVSCELETDLRYGIGKSTLPLMRQLQKNGHTTYYLYQTNPPYKIETFILNLCRSPPLFRATLGHALIRFKMGAKAAWLAKRDKYTHVHCSDPVIATSFHFFSILLLNNKKVFWGFSEHGFGAYVQNRPGISLSPHLKNFLQFCEKKTSLQSHWLISPSFSGLQQLKQDLKLKNISQNWHSVYHAKPDIKLINKKAARTILGWKNDLTYIIAVGQLIELKQFPIFISACSELIQNPKIQVVILGQGDSSYLLQFSQTCNLANKALITHTDDIGLYLSASDLYVSTSATESFGMANLEAAVAGLPIICTRVGAVAEIMGTCALLIEPEKEALKKALDDVLSSPANIKKMAQKSHILAKNWPGIIEIAQQYEKIFLTQSASHAK
ncbi:MAG: glycosyltransferase [Methyloprofundus sp.]|nr:glycosyltransferase [Methyloprofundus sp.]